MESIYQVGEENSFTDEFEDKGPVFKAPRGSELLNQFEIGRWEDKTFYLLAVPLSHVSAKVSFTERNITLQRKEGNCSRERKMSSSTWVRFVDDEIIFNVPSRSERLWYYGGRFHKCMSDSHVGLSGYRYLGEKASGWHCPLPCRRLLPPPAPQLRSSPR